MTLYTVIRNEYVIAIAKTKSDASRVLQSKKYYSIPEPLVKVLKRRYRIYYYELYAMKLEVSPSLSGYKIGIYTLDGFKKMVEGKQIKFYDVYERIVDINSITASMIDESIQRTKQDLEKIERWKNRPKIYYFGDSDIRDNLVHYATRHGKEIDKYIYFYEKDDKYMIVDVYKHIGITLPKNVNLLEYENEIKEQIKDDDYLRRNLKNYIKLMLEIPELQEFASSLILLLDLV
jgi:hypothetical protein